MYQYDLADIVAWFSDSYDRSMVAIVYQDGSGGIWFDRNGFPYNDTLGLSDCMFEFDNLDDMVNRFDHLLKEG